ncbi:MAG: chromate efflux transporter [Polyangiaceae bacterium]|nr:chromate efflux transporter [Polyangiaceae bacterium]
MVGVHRVEHGSGFADSPGAVVGWRRLAEIAGVFLRLGCTSFGGPIAHLGYFRAELVEKRRWLDDARYGDLVALAQFLPGPASSQVVFALGMHRGGVLGAVVASLGFTLPSALLLLTFAHGVASAPDLRGAGWLHGLELAAVAVVASAVWGMGRSLCPDRARRSLCLAGAAVLLVAPGAATQLGVITLGALVGWWRYRDRPAGAEAPPVAAVRSHRAALASLAVFATLLVVLPWLAARTGARSLLAFDAFYRSGSLVFGGGHVVLPLLRAEVVPRGWLTDDQFLAGYAAAQAVPGPMFSFAAYLGAAMSPGPGAWRSGLGCLAAIFLPAWLLMGGVLPFWQRLRSRPWIQAGIAGANAAVVGVLLAALYDPIFTQSVAGPRDFVLALVAFGALEHWRAPAWLIVAACAVAGGGLPGA